MSSILSKLVEKIEKPSSHSLDRPEDALLRRWGRARYVRDHTKDEKRRRHFYELADRLQYELQDLSPLGRRMIWGSEFASKRKEVYRGEASPMKVAKDPPAKKTRARGRHPVSSAIPAREREIDELREILTRFGVNHSASDAVMLQREGMGPEELEHRLRTGQDVGYWPAKDSREPYRVLRGKR